MAKNWIIPLFLCVYFYPIYSVPRPLKIGIIFNTADTEQYNAFIDALKLIKSEFTAPAYDLQPVVKFINTHTDSFNSARAVCDVLGEGVAVIFGPNNKNIRGIISSIAERYQVPYIEYGYRRMEDSKMPYISINIYPDSNVYQKLIADMTKMMNWKSFTAIYDTDDALSRIQDALSLHGPSDSAVTVRQLGEGPDYRPLLKEVANSLDYNILLDVRAELLPELLRQAREVKLLSDYYTYILTYLDSTLLPIIPELNGTAANVTAFKLTTSNPNGYTMVESALLFDAVLLFSFTMEVLFKRTDSSEVSSIDPVPLSCEGETKDEVYEAGQQIIDLLKELARIGNTTGTMLFDEYGRRYMEPRVGEFKSNKFVETAMWSAEKGIWSLRSEEEREIELRENIERKVFKVTTREGAPYVMPVKDGSNRGVLINDVRYEGYCIDLIDAIAKMLNFKYEFELVPDTKYGSYHEETKSWDGLIKRLLDRKADLAICDLTITYARQKAVDFTMPFMNLDNISILFSKPENKEPDLFSFLSPLSTDVWLYMLTAYLSVSISVYFLARIAPSEWANPHPCNEEPEELENDFNIMNSMWLTMGSLMQQGGDILPKASSIRMIAGIWWFFVLIMVSSYTANLAAFLTAIKIDISINDVNDLAKQTKIKYGAVNGGSTLAFFKNSNTSVYQRMYTAMIDAKPSVFTETNDEGVERVLKGKRQYAFIMESTSIEYNIERHCELQQIGELLDSKSYGIALPNGSPYRTMISKTILKLQETGALEQMKAKWWKEMHGGGSCGDEKVVVESAELGMSNVGGVFVVLMFGLAFSVIVAIGEFFWNCQQISVEEKISYCEAVMHELKFVFSFHLSTKPVKVSKSSTQSGTSTGTFDRSSPMRRSIVNSVVGSYLRLNILDKRPSQISM